MDVLKIFVLVIFFTMHIAPYSDAQNTVSFMFPWPNPDPCGGEECVVTTEQGVDV